MVNNDVIRSVRYMLNTNDGKIVEMMKLADFEISLQEVQSFLKKDDEEGYAECNDKIMAHFLDGLIYLKRGRQEGREPVPFELPISNNLVIKKLRVAFELKEEDILNIFAQSGFQIGRPEVSSFLRKKGHRNYRECGDQILRNFLKGLTLRVRG